MLSAECQIEIENPFSGEKISKTDMALGIVLIDMFVVVLFCCFIWAMENSLSKYAVQFEEESIEMNDFALRMKGMPKDGQFDGKDDILRAFVMHHFSEVIRDQMALEDEAKDDDEKE